jgi:hypothetical protein
MAEEAVHQPLLCRTHLHHKWVEEHTDDGSRYMHCVRCGKDRTEVDSSGFGGSNYAAGAAGGGMGGGG